MAKTKRQKARRMQNRLQFEARFYRGDLNNHTCKGVGYRDAVKVLGGLLLPELKNDGSLNLIESRGKGRYNAFQRAYKGTGLGKHKTHIHAPSDFLYELREARKRYRKLQKVYTGKGGDGTIFDRLFKQKFPKQWRLIIENRDEFQ